MAFVYTADGQTYESSFHFWYLNGCQPNPEYMITLENRGPERERLDKVELNDEQPIWVRRYLRSGEGPCPGKERR